MVDGVAQDTDDTEDETETNIKQDKEDCFNFCHCVYVHMGWQFFTDVVLKSCLFTVM